MAEMSEVQCGIHGSQHVKRAAFIGTRRIEDVSRLCHDTYLDLVERAVGAGYTIRTGAAPGADQIAAARALHLGGQIELVLPWDDYEYKWVDATKHEFRDRVWIEVYDYETCIHWRESVKAYHPAWMKLSPSAYKLHARNYGIIELCDSVVALTAPDRQGGTEQGIRIAKGLGIRLIILESPTKDRSGRVVSGEESGDPGSVCAGVPNLITLPDCAT